MHISQVFFYSALSFLVGIGSVLFFDASFVTYAFLSVITCIVLSVVFYQKSFLWVVALCCMLFFFGAWHTQKALAFVASQDSLDDTRISTHAYVGEEPIQKSYYKHVVVSLPEHEYIKILLRVQRHTQIQYGDVIALQCTLSVPENFSDDFDYKMYLAMRGVYYVCDKKARYDVIAHDPGVITQTLLALRASMESHINRAIAAPYAGLANGLLFGGDDRLSQGLQDDFARTGMTHIVAVSGYNVTVITMVLVSFGIFCGLWRAQALWCAIGGIVIFIAMIGFPSSGVRAAIMGVIVLLAMQYGRIGSVLNVILCAAVGMLLYNPLLLRYDVGFQLSFMATLGLITLYPFFEKWFIRRQKIIGLIEIIFMTLCAQIFVLPIIAYHFHTISFISLFANVAVLAILPLTMFFSFITAVSGTIMPFVAALSGWSASLLLAYEVFIVERFAEISWASLTIAVFHPMWIMLYYSALFTGIILIKKYDTSL